MKEQSLKTLKGIGDKTERLFQKAGICNLNQLLHYYPRDYDTYGSPVPLGAVRPGEKNAVEGRVTRAPEVKTGGTQSLTLLKLQDETGTLQVNWFHMPFLRSTLKRGGVYIFRGRVAEKNGRRVMEQPEIFTPAQYDELKEKMQPIYALTAGLSGKTVGKAVRQAFQTAEPEREYLAEKLREEFRLCDLRFAMENIHFPQNLPALEAARRRLVFDEFLLFLLGLYRLRDKTEAAENKYPMRAVWKTEEIIDNLPYRLTGAQLRVWNEIERDLKGKMLMNRLVQGDVGSGKTILAFLAMVMAKENGYQSALMAPTEVLAAQHFETITKLLQENHIEDADPVLLTGSCTAAEKRHIYEKISTGKARLIIGTHALIQEAVEYRELALVITDEQHRFGVRQRTQLGKKGESPNVLVMSATPIPRTLSLIVYGDLDLSILDDLPPGRTPVKTRVVPEAKRAAMYGFVMEKVREGRQAYVICPLVDKSEAVEARDAQELYGELCKLLPEARVSLVHGRMKAVEKDARLEAFRKGETDILVSTTVVEVGVNVPNASVMAIENAERFGLAQLHQLRGRVGRGQYESWCFLVAEPSERLRLLTQTTDGFKIAEKDMELRGPGEMFGERQSGMLSTGLSMLAGDTQLLKLTHDEARALMKRPDDEETKQVVALARRAFRERLDEVALN